MYIQREIVDSLMERYVGFAPYSIYDRTQKMDRYLDFYGLDYSSVKYPSEHNLGYGSIAVSSINFVSSNVSSLYKR